MPQFVLSSIPLEDFKQLVMNCVQEGMKTNLSGSLFNYLPDFYENKGIRLHSVFLSHAHKDKEFADKLYEKLTARNVRVWFDEKKLKPGDEIREEIIKGISHYDKFIIVCSQHSLQESYWVNAEIEEALSKQEELYKKTNKKINNIIPITIDDYIFSGWKDFKKSKLKQHLIGDFQNWKEPAKFELALNKLIEALKADREDERPVSYF